MPGKSGTFTNSGETINATINEITNTPGTPPLSLQAASADGTTFIGIPNSSVDPSTGDVMLGAGFGVNDALGVGIFLSSVNGNGISFSDNSSEGNGLYFEEDGAGGITLNNEGTGPTNLTSAGTMTFDDTALSGGGSKLDLDATTQGVVTLSTIFNAVGGYQANGTPGISGSGTTMTNVTVVNGIITAATFT